MRFTLRQVEYFVAAADAGSITLASQVINISQPSISAAIAHLEDIFRLSLFLRHHAQGLSLTDDGRRFLAEARILLSQAQKLDSTARTIVEQISGPLSVGCMTTIYPLLVPYLFQKFSNCYPAVELNIVPGHHSELIEKLRRGEVSAILCYDLDSQFELDFKPLATLPPYALVAASHRLARRRTVSLAELCERDSLFLLDLPISRDYFLDMFRETGIQPEIGGQYQNLDVVRSLVARGTGFSLLNVRPRNKSALDGRPLSYVPLKGTGRSLIYGTARLAGVHPTAKLSAFLEFCNELLAGKPLPGTD